MGALSVKKWAFASRIWANAVVVVCFFSGFGRQARASAVSELQVVHTIARRAAKLRGGIPLTVPMAVAWFHMLKHALSSLSLSVPICTCIYIYIYTYICVIYIQLVYLYLVLVFRV